MDIVHLVVTLKLRPPRPANAEKLGLSDNLWALVERCWLEGAELRPQAPEVCESMEQIKTKHVKGHSVPLSDNSLTSAESSYFSIDSGYGSAACSPLKSTCVISCSFGGHACLHIRYSDDMHMFRDSKIPWAEVLSADIKTLRPRGAENTIAGEEIMSPVAYEDKGRQDVIQR